MGCKDDNINQYQKLNKVLEKSSRTLDECFELFDVAYKATVNIYSVYKATESVINDFAEDNVIYLELRSTPRSEVDMTKEDYVEAIVRAIKDNKNKIIVKLLLSINRKDDIKTSEDTLLLILKMHRKYPDIIKGIDLSGNPKVGFFNKALFQTARDAGLKISLHCAEVKNDSEVEDMLNFKPDRIGHATCIHEKYGGNRSLWEKYCKLKIPIGIISNHNFSKTNLFIFYFLECCLTSNVLCGTARGYEDHHVTELIKYSLPYCLGVIFNFIYN